MCAEEKPVPINTHDLFLSFGKYNRHRVTRVPIGLKWAVASRCSAVIDTREGKRPFWEVAEAEITRRGERIEDIDISAHAIDRLSLKFLETWKKNVKLPEEGLFSWAQRAARDAWALHETEVAKQDEPDVYTIRHLGIEWVIEELAIPVVKTVK